MKETCKKIYREPGVTNNNYWVLQTLKKWVNSLNQVLTLTLLEDYALWKKDDSLHLGFWISRISTNWERIKKRTLFAHGWYLLAQDTTDRKSSSINPFRKWPLPEAAPAVVISFCTCSFLSLSFSSIKTYQRINTGNGKWPRYLI